MLTSLLRSLFAQGRKPAAFGAAETRPVSSPRRRDVEALLQHAGTLVTDDVPSELDAAVRRFANVFDAARVQKASQALVVFQGNNPPGETVERMRVYCPRAVLYLVTAEARNDQSHSATDVRIVRLPVDRVQPIFQRALAVCAYVHSAAFSADTAFLDSDAFPDLALERVFDPGFDIVLPYRNGFWLMPVDPAAVFVRSENRALVQTFFRRVLATYAQLAFDPRICAQYVDVKRGRGDQLAVNAVVQAMLPFSGDRHTSPEGMRLRFLPCP